MMLKIHAEAGGPWTLRLEVQAEERADPPAEEVRVLLVEAVRELLLNVVKHAHTPRAAVQMRRDEAARTCIVAADEGCGFDPSGPDTSRGFGLFGIRHRPGLLGGTLKVESTPGRGTRTLGSPPELADMMLRQSRRSLSTS